MKVSSVLAVVSFSATLTYAQQWWDPFTSSGAWTAWADPNIYGPCAISCYKTASWPTPTASSDWPSYCATPPPNPIISCLSSSCSAAAAPWSAITAAESSLCSTYSSCSSLYSSASSTTLPPACAAWPWLWPIGGGKGWPGHYWPDDWIGTSGCSYFTVTAKSGGPMTGWTTTTETIVATLAASSAITVVTTTTVISATIARADVAAQTSSLTGPATTTASLTGAGTISSGSASASTVTTNTAAAVEGGMKAMGIFVALTFGIMVLL